MLAETGPAEDAEAVDEELGQGRVRREMAVVGRPCGEKLIDAAAVEDGGEAGAAPEALAAERGGVVGSRDAAGEAVSDVGGANAVGAEFEVEGVGRIEKDVDSGQAGSGRVLLDDLAL